MKKKKPATKRSMSARKPVFGVGINDSDYVTTEVVNGKSRQCATYSRWHSMLRRAYCSKYIGDHPTYSEVFVCTEWLVFSVFAKWCEDNYVDGYELDKDIKVKGNKIYSPETCLFIPNEVNKLFTDRASKRGSLPIGVSFDNETKKYRAHVGSSGKRKHLGRFDNKELASKAYKNGKNKEIIRVANANPLLSKYLMERLYSESEL